MGDRTLRIAEQIRIALVGEHGELPERPPELCGSSAVVGVRVGENERDRLVSAAGELPQRRQDDPVGRLRQAGVDDQPGAVTFDHVLAEKPAPVEPSSRYTPGATSVSATSTGPEAAFTSGMVYEDLIYLAAPRMAEELASDQTVRTRLEGISAVPVTPFGENGGVDEAGVRRVVARLVAAGLDVLVPCGNTGEFSSLTSDEAAQVVSITLAEAPTGTTVIAGVGGDVRTSVRLAQAAVSEGADGVMIHYPQTPYVTGSGLVRYYREVAGEIDGAVVLYLRDRGLPEDVFEDVLSIPNVVAVKYALPDVFSFARLVHRYPDRVVWVCGLAEMWAPFFWLVGGRGFTSGLVNVAPDASLAMLAALRDGDYDQAMRVWARIVPFEELRAREGNGNNVSVVKEAMALRAIVGATVRPPLAPLSPADAEELASILATWGAEQA